MLQGHNWIENHEINQSHSICSKPLNQFRSQASLGITLNNFIGKGTTFTTSNLLINKTQIVGS